MMSRAFIASCSRILASKRHSSLFCLRTKSFSTRPAVTVFSEEEEALRESVRRFAHEKIAPYVRDMDDSQTMHSGIVPGLFEQGFMGVEIGNEYGGAGMNFTGACIVIEELAKIDAGVSVMCDVQNTIICTAFNTFGNEEQKKKYLPLLAANTVGSFCLSESVSGSDAFALKTRAEKDGEHFLLNGTKCWITNAKDAGVFLVFANVKPESGYKGITAFIVDKENPGIRVGKKENKLGIRSSSTCEVILTDCRVRKEDILGKLGEGYKIAINLLNEGRIGIAAQMLGIAEGAFSLTLPYIHSRVQFGQRIADFQGMQFQYAEIATDIECAKLLTYNAARLKEMKRPFLKEAAMAKHVASTVAEKTASMCIELVGGVGITKDFLVEKYYRDAKIGKIYEGTSNIQLQTIAKAIQADYK